MGWESHWLRIQRSPGVTRIHELGVGALVPNPHTETPLPASVPGPVPVWSFRKNKGSRSPKVNFSTFVRGKV